MTPMKRLALYAEPLLRSPYVLRVRRNHGLEHATVHILSRSHHRLSGRSSESGFVLLGAVPTEEVESAVQEALQRMKAGERGLAVHPNCGTNLVTAGYLATLVGFFGFAGRGWRSGWQRFPSVMTLMMAVVVLSPPLGISLQRHFTTEGDLGDLQVVSVSRQTMSIPFSGRRVTVHRVRTK